MSNWKAASFASVLAILLTVLTLAGCSAIGDLFTDKEPPLPGERLSVLDLQKSLSAESVTGSAGDINLPQVWRNEFWPQAGGYPSHAMQHLYLDGPALKPVWQVDIGEGSNKRLPLTAQPVVVDGRIFTLDTDFSLRAHDMQNGRLLWRTNIRDRDESDPVIGGGMAFAAGYIYASNGYSEVMALNPNNGDIVWRSDIPAPARAAPTVLGDRLYVTTLDNRLLALSAANGALLWEYSGLSEGTALVGAASPAASQSIVVPVFSSGEVLALRVENGSVAWSDNLSGRKRFGGAGSLSDIRAMPVIDRGIVFAISVNDRMAAIDERSGTRIWQHDIGGWNTPWVVGDVVFIVSEQGELSAMARESGAVRWVKQLPKYEDEEDREDPVYWIGPLLASGRLLVFGSHGQVLEADVADGRIIGMWRANGDISISPIIAGGTLYVLDDSGTLTAYR